MSGRCEPIHLVVPDGIRDPLRPSGGNTYDRNLCRELRSLGWKIHERAVAGFWNRPDRESFADLERALRQIPDGAIVLLDGLIASAAPEILVMQSRRLRLVVLVHMPFGHAPGDDAEDVRRGERTALHAAAAVVTTSAWARHRLIELYGLTPPRVHVAEPGVDAAQPAGGTATGGALLCVATVTFAKGHDVLFEALDSISEICWRCTCVGRVDRDPLFVEHLRRRALEGALHHRVSFPGPMTGAELAAEYARADLLVLASRAETYGMVVTEALARALPVIAADVGGLGEAVGHCRDGSRPGLLVSPADSAALGGALRAWLVDAGLRARLRRAASERRDSLPRWSSTASVVAGVLREAAR